MAKTEAEWEAERQQHEKKAYAELDLMQSVVDRMRLKYESSSEGKPGASDAEVIQWGKTNCPEDYSAYKAHKDTANSENAAANECTKKAVEAKFSSGSESANTNSSSSSSSTSSNNSSSSSSSSGSNSSSSSADNNANNNGSTGAGPSSAGNSSGVPLYHQWDKRWADHPYGSDGSTICSSGCGPTSFAMICAWYGKNVTPDIAGDDFLSTGHRVLGQGTDHTAFQDRGPSYGVEFKYTNSKDDVRAALKNGYPVIAAHGDGKFTGGGHYIVYAKLDDKGLIINDPNQGGSRNKTGDDYHWDLEEVLADGGVCDWWIPTTSHDGIQPNFNAQSQAEGGNGPAGASNKANGPANNTMGGGAGWVEINPKGKTYCEPVYPDYIFVQGNVPNTTVENTAVNGMENMDKAGEYGIMTSQGMQDLMGLNANAFTTDQAQKLAQRQFDPQNSISEVKVPSAGKPLNNNDPYPIDLKIEELENHQPRVKQYKLPYSDGCTRALAEAILKLSDFSEKRIVKLENVLATVMRYTFAIGKRMHVNCIYWGGTDHRSKYVGIRCLKDNLLEDGQVMQLDQCLSCSRYEPVIGQTYDILNEVGANLANIQDDIASGMMNMEDYINYLRIEQMHDRKLEYQLNYKTTKTRNQNERPFKDQWDDGVKMGWKLVPVEEQKPQINWRQDINSDDKSPEKLASYQGANGPGSSGLETTVSLTPGDYKSTVDGHKKFMDDVVAGKFDQQQGSGNSGNKDDNKSSDKSGSGSGSGSSEGDKTNTEAATWWPKAKDAIKTGLEAGKRYGDEAVKNLKLNGYEQTLQRACSEVKVDPVMGMALIAVLSQGDPAKGVFGMGNGKIEDQISEGAKKLKELTDSKNKNGNPIGPVTAWKGWSETLSTLLNSPMKLGTESGSSSGGSGSSSSSSSSYDLNTRMFDWEWRKALDEAKVEPTFFPAVIQAYQVIDAANTGLSQLKNQDSNIEFPIDTPGLNNVYWVQDFGVTNVQSGVSVVSDALVFKCKAPVTVHAPEDCGGAEIQTDNTIGKYIKMKSMSSGYTYYFGGLSDDKMSQDKNKQNISRGEKCATVNEKFILKVQDKDDKYIDPKVVWRLLAGLSVTADITLGAQVEKINNKGINPVTASTDSSTSPTSTMSGPVLPANYEEELEKLKQAEEENDRKNARWEQNQKEAQNVILQIRKVAADAAGDLDDRADTLESQATYGDMARNSGSTDGSALSAEQTAKMRAEAENLRKQAKAKKRSATAELRARYKELAHEDYWYDNWAVD